MKLHEMCRKTARAMGIAALISAVCLVFDAEASGVTNVTITSVAQRWPWNYKVDISYSVEGGQTRTAGVYCGLRFTLTAGGNTYDIPGYSIGASAENGDHTVTWTAPKGIVASDCSLTATLFTTNVPSGNDYMIIDLNTGDVVFEGAYATQDESNSRYNVDTYKEYSMVLRKVPKWADKGVLPNAEFLSSYNGYRTGGADSDGNIFYNSSKNSAHYWATGRDYYLGVFPVTQRQYRTIGADAGNNPSERTDPVAGNNANFRPVEKMTWYELRRPTGVTDDFASTSPIPKVTSMTGTFFQRLNFLTGNTFGFDLPTEVMLEIAERAGSTTIYFWGDTASDGEPYAACATTLNKNTMAVGHFLPNAWGFYDIDGNVACWCRDSNGLANLADAPNAFTPTWVSTATKRRQRGGNWTNGLSSSPWRSSFRNNAGPGDRSYALGFRVSYIPE